MLNWLRIRLLQTKKNIGSDRPIRFVQEKENVWRVVYADGQSQPDKVKGQAPRRFPLPSGRRL